MLSLRPAIAAALLVLLCGGCYSDLNNVRVYADGLQALRGRLSPVAEDFVRSCYRGAELSYHAKLAAKPGDAGVLARADAGYAQDAALCEQWKGMPHAYAANLGAVIAYGAALQRLTQDHTVDYGDELSEMLDAADELTGTIADQNVDAVVGDGFKGAAASLAATLGKWVGEGYRRGEVKQAIVEGAPATGVILAGLYRFANDVYKKLFLTKEDNRLKLLYKLLEARADAQTRVTISVQRQRLQSEYLARIERVDELLAHLDAASQANAALLERAKSSQLEGKALFAQVKPLVKEILGVAKAWKEVQWNHAPVRPQPAPLVTPEPEAAPTDDSSPDTDDEGDR